MCHSAEAEPALTCEKHRVSDIPQQIPVVQLTNASEAMAVVAELNWPVNPFLLSHYFIIVFCLHAFSTASLEPSTWLKRKTHFISFSLFFTLYSHCILSVALPVSFHFSSWVNTYLLFCWSQCHPIPLLSPLLSLSPSFISCFLKCSLVANVKDPAGIKQVPSVAMSTFQESAVEQFDLLNIIRQHKCPICMLHSRHVSTAERLLD